MIVLALDASLGTFSAALVRDGDEPVAHELPGRLALEGGLRAAAAVLEQAAISPRQLDRLAVGIGPGTFTGVRIAISFAKSLALGWKLPLCAISTFDAVEAGLDLAGRDVLTAVHGRSGVVSVRLRTIAGEVRASGYVRDAIDTLASALPKRCALVGNGAEDVRAALGERGIQVEILAHAIEPAALAIATLAVQRKPARSLHEVRADYGELPAVTVPKK